MSRIKPVVAVASATRPPGLGGDLPGPDAKAVTALFARSGVIRVDTVAELFDVGLLLAHQPLPAGRRVAVVGNSSALSGLAVAACRANGLTVADGYPRDISPQAGAHDFADALADAAVDQRVDALVVVFAPPLPGQLPDEDADFAAALGSVALAGEKPTVATFLLGESPPRVPAYPSVEEAVRALGRVAAYADWLRAAARRAARSWPVSDRGRRATARRPTLLAAYGIPVVPSLAAASLDEVARGGGDARLPGGAEGRRASAAAPHRPGRRPARPGRRRRRPRRVRRAAWPPSARTCWCSRWSRPAWPAWSRWWRIRRSARWSASASAAWPPTCSATWPGGPPR